MAFGIRIATAIAATTVEVGMDGDYVFLCGIMWCNYGWAEAGVELLRAADSDDPDAKALAMAMLTTKTTHSRKTATNLVDSRCGGAPCGQEHVLGARLS